MYCSTSLADKDDWSSMCALYTTGLEQFRSMHDSFVLRVLNMCM